MANKPKGKIMGFPEMVEMNQEIAQTSRLYSKDIDVGDRISAMISDTRQSIEQMPERISLNDTRTVRRVALAYLTACDKGGCLPSKIGLARACGLSRQAIDSFMSQNPGHSTTEFFEVFFDACAELLSNAALIGGVHPIFGIFVAKAVYKWKDVQQVEFTTNNSPLHSENSATADEIAAKYAELPAD